MNFKISGIAAGIAFIFSLLIGFIRGTGIFALARAFILGAVFFFLSGGVYWLILQFLPELLEGPEGGENKHQIGSVVDISLEEDSEDGIPDANLGEYIPAEEAEEPSGASVFENLSGLDQKDNIEYTSEESLDENSPMPAPETESTPQENTSGFADELPDLESLSAAFSPDDKRRDEEKLSEFIIAPDSFAGKKTGGSNKSDVLDSDFSAHDMASAVQTILKRE
jgi:hypothetical protein